MWVLSTVLINLGLGVNARDFELTGVIVGFPGNLGA